MFLGDLLPAMEAQLGVMGPVWSRVALAVRRHMEIMDEHPWVLPEGAVTAPCPPRKKFLWFASVFGFTQYDLGATWATLVYIYIYIYIVGSPQQGFF